MLTLRFKRIVPLDCVPVCCLGGSPDRIFARWEHVISASYRVTNIIKLLWTVLMVTHWVGVAGLGSFCGVQVP